MCQVSSKYIILALQQLSIKTLTLVSVRLLHMGDNFKTNRLLKHVSYAYMASLVTAYAALRPRDGFSHPHQEYMKDTYIPAPEVDTEILVPYARNSIYP